jgi:hypothetical protein
MMKKNILKLFVINMSLCIGLMIAGCGSGTVESNHVLNGTVIDEFDSPIPNVTVTLQSQLANLTTKTDATGKYMFKDLELGSYDASFVKDGFTNETKTIEIIWGRNTEYNCSLQNTEGIPLGGTALVTVTDAVAISDGICLWMETSNAQKFYSYCPDNDEFAGFSDVEIINYLIKHDNVGYPETYWTELTPNTNYTVYIVAQDAQGRAGALVKKQIKTKPVNNQPVADINITSAGGGNMSCDITKNSYCSSWSSVCLYGVGDVNSLQDIHDIEFAAEVYLNSKVAGELFTTDEQLSFFELQDFAIIITMGFSSSGENSGVISKKIFDSNTGIVYEAPSSTSSMIHGSGKKGIAGKISLPQ